MSLVVDCSAVIAWTLEDEATPPALAIRERVAEAGATVPGHWHLEIANALLMAERRGRIEAGFRRRRLEDLAYLSVSVDQLTTAEAWSTTTQLAERHRLTAYDAAYLELALRTGLPLASLDADLNAAAERSGVEVLLA